jgi:hypothetical protein
MFLDEYDVASWSIAVSMRTAKSIVNTKLMLRCQFIKYNEHISLDYAFL